MSGIFLTSAIFLLFLDLILGNIVPVYSIDHHVKHGTNMSRQNQQNANMEEHGASVYNSSKSSAEQIMASCQDDDEHCHMMALDDLNKTVSRQLVLGTFLNLIQLYEENNYSCHHEGHHLGMWLYDYTSNLKEALNYATVPLWGFSLPWNLSKLFWGRTIGSPCR